MKIILLIIFLSLSSLQLISQDVITGSVTDLERGIPLIGVNIAIKGTAMGAISDDNGKFTIPNKISYPVSLIFSRIGYETFEVKLNRARKNLFIQLQQKAILGKEVIISASRIEESILESPVTIESMNQTEIKNTPAANYFDGMYAIKGVDMNVHSLTFRFPNARGFTGDFNYRMNQFVDGIDNASPGLSFPAGNIFGLSPLEIERAELLVGASSALYGPGGMNGTLLMVSKDPFKNQGLSISVQPAMMHFNAGYIDSPKPMMDFNLRFAKALTKRLAIRVGASYLEATDWYATDYRDKFHLDEPWINRQNNEGYDGVNVYGDDIMAPVNLKEVAPQVADGIAIARGFTPGTPEYNQFVESVIAKFSDQVISRNGWTEEDIVDYNTKTIRFNGSVHYKITDDVEANVRAQYGKGNSVYTAQNRFSFLNFSMLTLISEVKSKNFYVRAYRVSENSGDSYNVGGAGLQLNEAWKPSEDWYADYIQAFTQHILMNNDLQAAYDFARQSANNRDPYGNAIDPTKPSFPYAGSPEFLNKLDSLKKTSINEGGAKVIDKSSMYHLEGMYNFKNQLEWAEVIMGTSYRVYNINSEGTVFIDEPGDPIIVNQYGIFGQISKSLFDERLKLTLAGRFDKNQNFKGRATPRFSFVYDVFGTERHNIRGSVQTAYRFPSIPDQFTDLNVGPFLVIGGNHQLIDKYDLNGNPVYPLTGSNPITDSPDTTGGPYVIPEFKPERVISYELGYKGLYLNRMIFIDTYGFVNRYNGFLGTQVMAQNPYSTDPDKPEERYQMTVSTDEPIIAFGWAFGLDVLLPRRFFIKGNVAYNALEKLGDRPPGFQSRFNTPRYRTNLGIGNYSILRNIGFSVNWRWQEKFLWQSAFGTAYIPAFSMLDMQINYRFEPFNKTNVILKLGGSNILNNYYTTSFGSAQVGGLYYLSLLFDWNFN